MTGLKCTTSNCEHNCNYQCRAGVIQVGKTATCNTKQKRQNGILEQTKINIEAGKDFDYDNNPEVIIQCDNANCNYNRNRMCSSDIVNVADGMFRTKCQTRTTMTK